MGVNVNKSLNSRVRIKKEGRLIKWMNAEKKTGTTRRYGESGGRGGGYN